MIRPPASWAGTTAYVRAAPWGDLAAWTGNYRTDVFWVDDLGAVRDALS